MKEEHATAMGKLQEENRVMRDRLHDLQVGQRALPTKDDLVEELISQCELAGFY